MSYDESGGDSDPAKERRTDSDNQTAVLTTIDNTFYVLSTPTEDHLFVDRSAAISELQRSAGMAKDPDVSIAEVTVDGDDWTIKELPWRTIALELMNAGDDA